MKVQPVASPHAVQTVQTNTQASADARQRAIAKLSAQTQPAQQPVQNVSAVQPEEMPVVQASTTDTSAVSESQVSAEATPETPTPPVQEEQKPSPEVQNQLAILAKRERQLRQKAQAQDQVLKQKEQALAAKEAELAAKEKQYSEGYISKDALKSQTSRTLYDTLGDTWYDQVTQDQINAGTVHPQVQSHINRLEQQIKRLETANEENQRQQTANQDQAYQAALNQIQRDATQLVKTNADFELIRNTGNIKAVVKLIEDTFKADGVLMDVEEAAAEVEKELEDRYFKVYETTEKIKKRTSAAPAAKPIVQQAPPSSEVPKQQQTMKTLTNAHGSTRKLTAKERAILAFDGKLKE